MGFDCWWFYFFCVKFGQKVFKDLVYSIYLYKYLYSFFKFSVFSNFGYFLFQELGFSFQIIVDLLFQWSNIYNSDSRYLDGVYYVLGNKGGMYRNLFNF